MIRTSRLLGFGLLAGVAVLSMLAMACGDDDSTSTATAPAAAVTSAPTKLVEATKAPASPASPACPSPAASAAAISPGAAAGPTVIVADNSYSPLTLTVAKGTTVTWQWSGTTPHQVAGNFIEGQYVRSPELTGGCTWAFTFNTPGTYPYACPIHGSNHKPGTIIVQP